MTDETQVKWNQISCAEREALVDALGRSCNGFSEASGVCVLAGRTARLMTWTTTPTQEGWATRDPG